MLYVITQALNYDYDKVQLQRDCYRPIVHGNIENTQLAILSGLDQVVNNGRPLPMYVVNFPQQEQSGEQGIHGKFIQPTADASAD